MPSDQRALTRAARERAQATGENYTAARAALIAVRNQPTSTVTIASASHLRMHAGLLLLCDRCGGPCQIDGYPDETDVTVDELGWRALPPDATAAQRARAEAIWRAVTVERPCRCSGPCLHGERCTNGDDGIMSCTGFLQHYDRYPGSMLEPTAWTDDYVCATCGEEFDTTRDLPGLPWGEVRRRHASEGTIILMYDGVRHPSFNTADEPKDCPDCFGRSGDGRCVCDEESGCQECGAGSAGDPYGECVCEPE